MSRPIGWSVTACLRRQINQSDSSMKHDKGQYLKLFMRIPEKPEIFISSVILDTKPPKWIIKINQINFDIQACCEWEACHLAFLKYLSL